jgi:Group II intron, maturase-specific domain
MATATTSEKRVKTRIIHVQQGFDFLGYRIVRGVGKSKLPRTVIQRWNSKGLIACPTRKSIRRFRDRVRMLTRRSAPRKTAQLIKELNPALRGWVEYYKRAHVRTPFHKLDGWIVRRLWSHRFCRWRSRGWIDLPKVTLYEEFGLVNLISCFNGFECKQSDLIGCSKRRDILDQVHPVERFSIRSCTTRHSSGGVSHRVILSPVGELLQNSIMVIDPRERL